LSRPLTVTEWLALLEDRHPRSIDLGLERVRLVWERMGKPRPARKLITVAGTNGKGSTVAYICSMLQALGHTQGSYTSPHLFCYNERVQIQGRMISDRELIQSFNHVESALENTSLSYFEFGTLAAFDWLSRSSLDYAILEVGLGGRLDAVNILDTDCAVITPIGIDHQEYLGRDRESIGREKAGIIRSGIPVICGDTNPPKSLLAVVRQNKAGLQKLGIDFSVETTPESCIFQQGEIHIALPESPLPGYHQLENMATALAAVAAISADAFDHVAELQRGLVSIKLPGRLQRSSAIPRVWLDVGHNANAARAIATALPIMKIAPVICVFGMLRNKDALEVASILNPWVDDWYCAGLGGDRGRSGDDLSCEILPVTGSKSVRVFKDVHTALGAALDKSDGSENILVFGSFSTVEQASAFLACSC